MSRETSTFNLLCEKKKKKITAVGHGRSSIDEGSDRRKIADKAIARSQTRLPRLRGSIWRIVPTMREKMTTRWRRSRREHLRKRRATLRGSRVQAKEAAASSQRKRRQFKFRAGKRCRRALRKERIDGSGARVPKIPLRIYDTSPRAIFTSRRISAFLSHTRLCVMASGEAATRPPSCARSLAGRYRPGTLYPRPCMHAM